MNDRISFSRRGRWTFHAIYGVLIFSGFAWMAAHWFGRRESEFGPVPSPAEPLWLKVHGAAAMGVLILLGYLLAKHVKPAWRAGRNRRSGILMLIVNGGLIATGYLLYYAGAEWCREWSSAIHLALGSALPLALVWHVRRGRRGNTLD